MDSSPSSLILIGVILYIVLTLVIGLWSSRKVKNFSDFLIAGRNLPFPLALATLFATWFGGGTCMGGSGTAYTDGILGVIADPYAAGFALIIAGLFYVRLLRRLKLLTVTDIFGLYYGKGAEIFASILMVPVYIGWLGSQMVALGLLINLFTGISSTAAIIVGALIVLVYTYAGGMWAVTLTDFIQVIVLIAGLLILFPIVLGEVGGLSHLIDRAGSWTWEFFPSETNYETLTTYLGDWALMGLGVVVGQDLIQRSLASRNEKIAQSSAISAGVLYLTVGSIPVLLGISGRFLLGDVSNPEAILPMLSLKYLPDVLSVVFVGALISAIMSSADSSLLAATSLVTNNIIKPFTTGFTDAKALRAARFSTVIITLCSMLVALYVKEIYSLMVNSWATLLVAILVPVTAALYSKKANKVSAWFSMIMGLSTWLIYITAMANPLKDSEAIYSQGAFWGGVVSFVSYYALIIIFYRKIPSVKPVKNFMPDYSGY